MRVTTLILVLVCGALAFPREAVADKVKSNQETKLFARPGERAKVILKVGSGKMMTVLAKEGRWLKVRVSGRTGYVARSTVDLPDEGEIARNTRRRSFVDGRSKTRTFGGDAPDDRIGADAIGEGREDGGEDEEDEEDEPPAKTAKSKPAGKPAKPSEDDEEEEDENPLPKGKPAAKPAPTKVAAKTQSDDEDEEEEDDEDSRKRVKLARATPVYNEANVKSEVILKATKDTPLFPTGEKSGKFTEVENDEGDLGYVLTADIESSGGGESKKVASKDEDDDEEDGGEVSDSVEVGGAGGSQIDLRIRAGVSFLSQGLRAPGGAAGPPNNYNISTAAATIALGSGYYKMSGKKVYGVEGAYDYAKALPGIKVPMGKTTSISLHNVNVRGIFGLDFKKASGMMLLGRLGFSYSNYQVGNVKSMTENTALLPSEVIMAPTIGAALAMPRLTKSIGLRFSLDVIPLTLSYSQTKNLEDGKSPSAKGAVAGIGLTYKWKSSMDISAGYDLTYRSVTFGDAVMTSARTHANAKRTDTFHAVTVGIVKAF